ncbi:MAG: SecF protein, partial [Microgenomates group bacterium GW2011_GWC1_39_7b]
MKYRPLFLSISTIVIIVGILSILKWGLKIGIDFKGGTLIEYRLQNGEKKVERYGQLGDVQIEKIRSDYKAQGATEERLETVGPTIGGELLQKAFSYAASTLVDYYFYDNTDNLYYDLPKFAKGDIKLDVFKVLFFRSNTSIFDRLYLTLIISQKDKDKFRIFNSMTYKNQEEFSKNVLGLF